MESKKLLFRCALLLTLVVVLSSRAEAAITGVSSGGTYDLRSPVYTSTPSDTWYYNSAMTIQLDATHAGLLADIRRNGTRWYDYEAGTDLIMIDSMAPLDAATAIPISRPTYEYDPDNSSFYSLTSVFPMYGGFVPLGAAVGEEQLHPYDGTGFGINYVGFYPANPNASWSVSQCHYRLELRQFNYDGNVFTSSTPERISASGLRIGNTDKYIQAPGFSSAIPDGNDLLFPVLCTNGENGVARFQYGDNGWQPVSFVPVTSVGTEPSLVRDASGNLLFSNRQSQKYYLWQSTDGEDWNSKFITGSRLATPVILSTAADGTAYFSGNPPSTYPARNTLQITPLRANLQGVETAITILDGYASWGVSPDSNDPDTTPDGWYIDHGYGNSVRLADGQWHGVFVHRALAQAEQDGSPATPYTGLYMEEVYSDGPQVPIWNFLPVESHTSTLFYDNFQSDAFYPPTNTGPVIGAGDIGGTWVSVEGTSYNNVEVVSEDDTTTGDHWCQLRDSGTHPAQAWAMLDSNNVIMTLNQTITLSSAIYKDSGGQSEGFALVDAAEATEALDGQLFHINFQEDGSITYYDPADNGGTTYTLSGVDYTPHSWQNFTLTADMAAKTFTLAVEGHGTDSGSWLGDANKIQAVACFSGAEDTGYIYMDYVRIDTSSDSLPLPGDANNDCYVDGFDAQILAEHWLMGSGAFWWDGDFNGDGIINDADATILAANWNPDTSASVPEPGMIVMLLAGALPMVIYWNSHGYR